jgi:hypothetical protein
LIPANGAVDDALIQQATIVAMQEPSAYDLNDLQHYLETREMGPLALRGEDAEVWGSTTDPYQRATDLITLCPRQREDPFSNWVTESGIKIFFKYGCHRRRKPHKVHGMVGYEDGYLLRMTYWLTSILASVIPVLSIVVLYVVTSMTSRLVIIAAFNILLSIGLTMFTKASRSETFAITATYVSIFLFRYLPWLSKSSYMVGVQFM